MPNLEQFVDFDPEKEIPPLDGKVVFITGGTAGLGRATVTALAQHNPAHIYFTGRNAEAAESLVAEGKRDSPNVGMTFIKVDMTSLASVKKACAEFQHDRLDVLICNAGVMFIPAGVSEDGFELHFAINHLAHALIVQELIPVMETTAQQPKSDVRVLFLTSTAWAGHPRDGITFDTLKTPQKGFMGSLYRYGQSKLANIVYAAELARRYSTNNIKFISVHPGAVKTALATSVSVWHSLFLRVYFWFAGVSLMEISQGRLSQLWAAAGAKGEDLVNGGFYMPVGRLSNDRLDTTAGSVKLATDLWDYTQDALARVE